MRKLLWTFPMYWGSMVRYSRLQSTLHPRRITASFITPMYCSIHSSQRALNWSGGRSERLIPLAFSTATSVGSPWQSHPWGKWTLKPRILLNLALMSK